MALRRTIKGSAVNLGVTALVGPLCAIKYEERPSVKWIGQFRLRRRPQRMTAAKVDLRVLLYMVRSAKGSQARRRSGGLCAGVSAVSS